MKRMAFSIFTILGVFTGESVEGGIIFQDSFESYSTGTPPTGWTEWYGVGPSSITREEAAAVGLIQQITDTVYTSSPKSVHILDNSTTYCSALRHGFTASPSMILEYNVRTEDYNGGIEICLHGNTEAVWWTLGFRNDGYIGIYGGDLGWATTALMPYDTMTWYHVRHSVDCSKDSGLFEIWQLNNPTNSASIELSYENAEFVDIISLKTSGMFCTNYYVDDIIIVPEPSSLILLSVGSISLLTLVCRRRRRSV